MAGTDELAKMKEKAAAVQTIVAEMESLYHAFLYAIEVTKNQGGATIAAPGLPPEECSQLAQLCQQAGITLVTENIREHIGKIHTGLTLGGWGMAETATLVLDSSSENVRIATMLSETHVAVLPRSRIKADAMELEPLLTELMKSAPRYLAFISGASRTADIERVLTIGVHGPHELHLVILDEELAGE
jgi:L-lactate dehydrogenase complex protein LldG